MDAGLRAFGLRPVRCNKCAHRFYRFPKMRPLLVVPLLIVTLVTGIGLYVAINIAHAKYEVKRAVPHEISPQPGSP